LHPDVAVDCSEVNPSGPCIVMPILNGPYRPNRALDHGTRLAECPAPDNLVWQDDHLLFTSGNTVFLLDGLHDGGEAEEILRFERAVTAMAAADDGSLAIGLVDGGIVIVGGDHDRRTLTAIGGEIGSIPTALCFADPHMLFVCLVPIREKMRPEGSLWRIDLRGTEPICLAAGLVGPSGLLLQNFDTLIVSESGCCRLLECSATAPRASRLLLDGLPGEPARLARGAHDSVWLATPTLSSRSSLQMPYGLVVHLSADLAPQGSLHGASGGRSRGVTSCLEARGELIVACRADDALILVDLGHPSER
jgi:hypothetical protein